MADPPPTTQRTVTLFDDGNLAVWAHERSDGSVDLEGQDLRADYEYHFTISSVSLPRLAEALGGTTSDDLLALLQSQVSKLLPRPGERAWLDEHDVPYDFFGWS